MQSAKHEPRLVWQYPAPECIVYCPWLLKDLLEHEMRESLLVYLAKLKVNLLHLRFNTLVPDGFQYHLILAYHSQVIIIEIDDPLGMLHYRCGIRGNEILIFSHTYH